MRIIAGFCLASALVIAGVAAGTSVAAEPFADSILGVHPGMTVSEAREILAPLGESAGRETRSGGRKEGYLLTGTPYTWIAFKAGHGGKLKWVSANLRAGAELPFARLGPVEEADSANEFQVIWNIPTDSGGYRLVAKGENHKARIVYLLALD